ncbi:Myb-like DNA-binding domain containing protein [Trichomonas vaginalis G3]|uniref:Myb-like DNA-binding domain containing protein n=1 Tax=Trichomonas vaginalis (strain ATCC PRA-98 / G3) TaxID=412133 RepID=A2FIY3_TRIV3|nr:RNA polymerase II transcription regulator recruiting protein [Trichomonas vaginalis G3]EAX95132.1 Myb-like DNA-binding domain containing protein [Trichomonas vaginalis G3]KAI5496069.1 RNA polymerase II transcription regulator recruiting protein [Trichomonas vaginalis G3]|eukprot:XP_001308062.1 Myb-like DNA-binding domain containing protein [Trichomonas vaginalis G3]
MINKKANKKGFVPKIKFTAEEDKMLTDLVSKIGAADWDIISKNMKNRTPRQCRERWINYIAPNLSNEPWTKEEDDLLDELYEEYGSRWHKIADIFPNRSGNCIRNRFKLRQRRKEKKLKMDQKNNRSTNIVVNPSIEHIDQCIKSIPNPDVFEMFDFDENTIEQIFTS